MNLLKHLKETSTCQRDTVGVIVLTLICFFGIQNTAGVELPDVRPLRLRAADAALQARVCVCVCVCVCARARARVCVCVCVYIVYELRIIPQLMHVCLC